MRQSSYSDLIEHGVCDMLATTRREEQGADVPGTFKFEIEQERHRRTLLANCSKVAMPTL